MQKLGYKLLPLLLIAASTAACTTASTTGTRTPSTAGIQVAATDQAAPAVVTFDSDDEASDDWQQKSRVQIDLKGDSASVTGNGAAVSGNTVMILASGLYVVSGTWNNGQIIVDSQTKGTVQLVLNGMQIHSAANAPIWVKNADKTVNTLPEGTQNVVSDGAAYDLSRIPEEDQPTGAIFSKDDLTINGTGALTVRGAYKDGITSKDKLVITGGNVAVTAKDDGLVGRDRVAVKDGQITIDAGGDGIKATNDSDPAKGYIALAGGTFGIKAGQDGIQAVSNITLAGGEIAIAAGDDAVHADTAIAITGGTTKITASYEGVESQLVTISGGQLHVTSQDDGINVGGGMDGSSMGGRPGPTAVSSKSNAALHIDGGYIAVSAMGDGIDVNGSIFMTDGTVVVSGPTANNNGALDYDVTFEMTGGVVVAAGSAGMAQAPATQSTQHAVLMSYSTTQAAGTMVSLKDSQGNPVVTYAPQKQYQSVVVASPALKKGETYTFYSGGTATGNASDGLYTDGMHQGGTRVVSFAIANIVTYLNESGVTTGSPNRMGGPPRGK